MESLQVPPHPGDGDFSGFCPKKSWTISLAEYNGRFPYRKLYFRRNFLQFLSRSILFLNQLFFHLFLFFKTRLSTASALIVGIPYNSIPLIHSRIAEAKWNSIKKSIAYKSRRDEPRLAWNLLILMGKEELKGGEKVKRFLTVLCVVLLVFGMAGAAGACLIQNSDFSGGLVGWDSWEDVQVDSLNIGGVIYPDLAVLGKNVSTDTCHQWAKGSGDYWTAALPQTFFIDERNSSQRRLGVKHKTQKPL